MKVAINHSASRRQLSGIAALATPLLAASAVALEAAIIQQPDSFAQAQIAVLILTAAVVSLLVSITSAIWANYYDAAGESYPTPVVHDDEATAEEMTEAERMYDTYRWWSLVAIHTFTAGWYLLLAGVGAALIPNRTDVLQYAAIGVIFMGGIAGLILVKIAPKPTPPAPQYVQIEE